MPYGRGINSVYQKEDIKTFSYKGKLINYSLSNGFPVWPIEDPKQQKITFSDLPRFTLFHVADASTPVLCRKITPTSYILDDADGYPTVYILEATTEVVPKKDSINDKVDS
jgi:hypothetical protein